MATETTAPTRPLIDAAREWPRQAFAYLRAIMGADAYERYCEHLSRSHPDAVPLSERDFWREHFEWQDEHPQGRCC